MRAAALLFGLFALLQLSSIRTASAWNLTGHRWIALDALTVLPAPMKEALTPHASALLAGLLEPDSCSSRGSRESLDIGDHLSQRLDNHRSMTFNPG